MYMKGAKPPSKTSATLLGHLLPILLWSACNPLWHAIVPTTAEAAVIYGPVTNEVNHHVYYLLGESTWTSAEAEAVNLGGHLATIRNDAENHWLVDTFSSFGGSYKSVWIGLYDPQGT